MYERYASTLYTGETQQLILKSYVRFDANIQKKLNDHWLLSLQLTNIGYSNYESDIGFTAA